MKNNNKRAGRLRLANKLSGTDKEIWNKFLVNVNKKLVGVDHQITIKRRHVTFRKW